MKNHAELKISIPKEGGIIIETNGCQACLVCAIAVLYDTDEKFKELMRKAVAVNPKNTLIDHHKHNPN